MLLNWEGRDPETRERYSIWSIADIDDDLIDLRDIGKFKWGNATSGEHFGCRADGKSDRRRKCNDGLIE